MSRVIICPFFSFALNYIITVLCANAEGSIGQDEGRYRCHPVNYLCYCVMHGLVLACMLVIMECMYGAIHDQFNTCIGLHMYNTYALPAGQYVEVHA